MIAPRKLPPEYRSWNRRWSAPSGRRLYRLLRKRSLMKRWITNFPRLRGLFGMEDYCNTREFEYPWAFFATPLERGLRVLEVGGGLCGFQFVLSKCGMKVTNVDPGLAGGGRGLSVTTANTQRLNRAFGTDVELRNSVIDKSGLNDEAFDRAFSISVIEHIPREELPDLMQQVYRVLKPGGFFVLTVDLFLNLAPFSLRESNRWGTNVSVKWLVEQAPFELVHGRPDCLLGYPEFEPAEILGRLEEFLLGDYPVVAQTVVLRKPSVQRVSAACHFPNSRFCADRPVSKTAI